MKMENNIKMLLCSLFLTQVLCTLGRPFFLDDGCKEITRNEFMKLYRSNQHITTYSSQLHDSNVIFYVRMTEDFADIHSYIFKGGDDECFIKEKFLKNPTVQEEPKVLLDKMDKIVERINGLYGGERKTIYLSVEESLCKTKGSMAFIEEYFTMHIFPNGSSVSCFPDRFNKRLQDLDDDLLNFIREDYEIHYLLDQTFVENLCDSIASYINEQITSISHQYKEEEQPREDSIISFMVEQFKKMNLDGIVGNKGSVLSLIKFLMSRDCFKEELDKVIDKFTDEDLKKISENLDVFDFEQYYQDEGVLTKEVKEEIIRGFKDLCDIENLKNLIHFLFYTIAEDSKDVKQHGLVVLSTFLSKIQKSSDDVIMKIFSSRKSTADESLEDFLRDEIRNYLKAFVKTYSKYLRDEQSVDDDLKEEFESLKLECFGIIESERLYSSNIMTNKAFELLKKGQRRINEIQECLNYFFKVHLSKFKSIGK